MNQGDLIKQKRLPDLMCDLVNKASLNGRYYLKDFTSTDVTLLPEETIQVRIPTGFHKTGRRFLVILAIKF